MNKLYLYLAILGLGLASGCSRDTFEEYSKIAGLVHKGRIFRIPSVVRSADQRSSISSDMWKNKRDAGRVFKGTNGFGIVIFLFSFSFAIEWTSSPQKNCYNLAAKYP